MEPSPRNTAAVRRHTDAAYLDSDITDISSVVLEVKASQVLTEADRSQLLNYLRGSRLEVGLLLHFGPMPNVERLIYTNERKSVIKSRH